MSAEKTKQKKFNPLNIFKKKINPEFREYVEESLEKIEKLYKQFIKKISRDNLKALYESKIQKILKDISTIIEKFKLYASKFKFYTEETERSLRKFGFLMKELIEELEFNMGAFDQEQNEIYLLNIVNQWTTFNSSIKSLFYNIENNEYPYIIHTIFSLAFVLVPFLNIFSLVGGIYLITQKDWRAIIFGTITLVLYFIQIINVFSLAILT